MTTSTKQSIIISWPVPCEWIDYDLVNLDRLEQTIVLALYDMATDACDDDELSGIHSIIPQTILDKMVELSIPTLDNCLWGRSEQNHVIYSSDPNSEMDGVNRGPFHVLSSWDNYDGDNMDKLVKTFSNIQDASAFWKEQD